MSVILSMSDEDADTYDSALADVLCWLNGFNAGAATCGSSEHTWTIGVQQLRELRTRLSRARKNEGRS